MKKRNLLIPLSVLLHASCAYAATYTVMTTADALVNPDGTIPGEGTSLRSAMLQANAVGSPGGIVGGSNTITFDPNVFNAPQAITLNNDLPLVYSNVDIQGPTSGVIIDGRLMVDFLSPAFLQMEHLNPSM
jgi:hypothetical protein